MSVTQAAGTMSGAKLTARSSPVPPAKSLVARLKDLIRGNPALYAAAGQVRSLPHRCVRAGKVRTYFKTHTAPKLHVGCGATLLDGWLNTDFAPQSREVIYLDAARPLPFPDTSFDYVFSEHLIEHLPYLKGAAMLRECFRVLKPGGRVRIATPDLTFLIRLYTEPHTALVERYIRRTVDWWIPEVGVYDECFVLNNFVRNWGHQFIYDPKTLRRALESAGFADVELRQPGESDEPALRGIESHGRMIGQDMNRLETMVLEARRPVAV